MQGQGNDCEAPIMCLILGAETHRKDFQQSLLSQSTGTSEPWEAQAAYSRTVIRALLLGGDPYIKEGPTLLCPLRCYCR